MSHETYLYETEMNYACDLFSNYQTVYEIGNSFLMKGDYDKALTCYGISISLNPDYPDSYNNRGAVYHSIQEFEKAIREFDEAIRLNPNYSSAFNNRGSAYYHLENCEKAIENFNESIRLRPGGSSAYCNRGLAYHDLGEYEKALSDYNTAIQIQKEYSTAYYNRGNTFYSLGDRKKALEDYNEALRLNPSMQDALTNRGTIYSDLGRFDEALKDFNEAIRLSPNYSDAYNNRGDAYRMMKEYEKAKDDFFSSLFFKESNYYSLCGLGKLFIEMGEMLKGMKYIKEMIDENPNNPNVYYLRSIVLSTVEEERALEDYFRFYSLAREQKRLKNVKDEEVGDEKNVHEIYQRLKVKIEEMNFWLPFMKDKVLDEGQEKLEISQMKEEISNSTVDRKIHFFRFLGGGAYAWTYLCRIIGVKGIFVIKVVKPDQDPSSVAKMKNRDCIELPYHRNIVLTLSNPEKTINISLQDLKKLPNTPKKIRERMEDEYVTENVPLILMKYHRKTLSDYIKQRKINPRTPFTPVELCYMLEGLLKGVLHLHNNKIVHRDLHEKNVFVDAAYGRIFIGDFGCCLDFRKYSDLKINVTLDDKDYFPSLHSNFSYHKGGSYLAPEVVDFSEKSSNYPFVDYSKNDLFSVGMLGYLMISSFIGNMKCAPYGFFVDDFGDTEAVTKGMKQKEYKELKYDKKICGLIGELLKVDPEERIGHGDAVKKIEEIRGFYEKRVGLLEEEEELKRAIQLSLQDNSEEEEEEEEGEDDGELMKALKLSMDVL